MFVRNPGPDIQAPILGRRGTASDGEAHSRWVYASAEANGASAEENHAGL